ncbi:MAG: hypothetical protein UT86_C0002G0080 [Candidatus Magasanikbacteria bacterium GW2011_GWC2_40_17]|uniref:Uncharacterized protein n=1 Tax=Candidatus Magasanikbacteria bacterium GW2011_GWA2_42_32 TaxID=1619039 RepID=A0A0G1CF90_9BACT|nr:MAG: hypothetical protein UT86_C0002G0080 [Candidatus Magasanikbacteria bacterium GW2011_GWC2_40_17]KKS57241.1 MAG: hypothetical protein UV20_C0002G0030 [Candidatus Magasanikbacteria bacterium GW2011_GWA2_42_32]
MTESIPNVRKVSVGCQMPITTAIPLSKKSAEIPADAGRVGIRAVFWHHGIGRANVLASSTGFVARRGLRAPAVHKTTPAVFPLLAFAVSAGRRQGPLAPCSLALFACGAGAIIKAVAAVFPAVAGIVVVAYSWDALVVPVPKSLLDFMANFFAVASAVLGAGMTILVRIFVIAMAFAIPAPRGYAGKHHLSGGLATFCYAGITVRTIVSAPSLFHHFAGVIIVARTVVLATAIFPLLASTIATSLVNASPVAGAVGVARAPAIFGTILAVFAFGFTEPIAADGLRRLLLLSVISVGTILALVVRVRDHFGAILSFAGDRFTALVHRVASGNFNRTVLLALAVVVEHGLTLPVATSRGAEN